MITFPYGIFQSFSVWPVAEPVHFIILCTSLWFSGGANSAGIHSADDPAEEAHERQKMPTTDGGHGGVAPRSKAESDAWCWA